MAERNSVLKLLKDESCQKSLVLLGKVTFGKTLFTHSTAMIIEQLYVTVLGCVTF